MLGKTHEMIGIATAATVISCTDMGLSNPLLSAALCAGVIIGSYFPDVDVSTSAINDKPVVAVLTFPFFVIRKLIKAFSHILKPLKGVSRLLSHRGVFHAPLVYALFFALYCVFKDGLGIYLSYALSGFFTGVFLHLLADFFTGGLRLLCPFYNEKIIPPIRFRSDGIINGIFIISSSFLIAYDIYLMLCRV